MVSCNKYNRIVHVLLDCVTDIRLCDAQSGHYDWMST